MRELKDELKLKLIERLNLEDIDVSDIGDEDSLFHEGLGLDSIDALEVIVMLEAEYKIILTSSREAREHFISISTLAKFVSENRK